ncbi:hypothetical protein QJS66_17075 [Kocuria rhizophila]|nr:hypothetical protein QJS66_17075 [Kocuria rhizophila]
MRRRAGHLASAALLTTGGARPRLGRAEHHEHCCIQGEPGESTPRRARPSPRTRGGHRGVPARTRVLGGVPRPDAGLRRMITGTTASTGLFVYTGRRP